MDFIQDKNHSILLSSHITTDLEKIADYITFIHNGSIILSEKKDVLIYNYGIMRCKTAQFEKVHKQDIVAYRKRDYQIDVLIADKQTSEKKCENYVIDNLTIEEIMLMLVKGVKNE